MEKPSERELLDEQEREAFFGGDEQFERFRRNTWTSVDSILNKAKPFVDNGLPCTGLALGYVQSGKTTSITALIAAAHDYGYKIIIGLVATNDILLDQNSDRILKRLGIKDDGRKIWFTSVQNGDVADEEQLTSNLEERGRTLLIMVLKNTPQIAKLSKFLGTIDTSKYKTLVVDDEADQVSLNTKIKKSGQSPTYTSILELRKQLSGHLYIQYTATPYANLLLTPDDSLAPDFVEVLTPGEGYTGGKRFFVEEGDSTFRSIGTETLKATPSRVPANLEKALATYLVGSALLFCNEPPELCEFTSMLINPHQENNVQEGYKTLLKRHLVEWKNELTDVYSISQLPSVFIDSYEDLVSTGVSMPDETFFLDQLRNCFKDYEVWLLNQTTSKSIKKVRWKEARLHILIGANKLDRGFTVEGLTVTYMSRKESSQIDTMQQRSRAYGYRPFMKYCRIYTTMGTRKILKDTVTTEEDLRDQLYAWIQSGRNFKDWAREIGIIVSANTTPTRSSVVKELLQRNLGGWTYLLKANTDETTLNYNESLIQQFAIDKAPKKQFGNQEHRCIDLDPGDVVRFISGWHADLVPMSQWDPAMICRAIMTPPTSETSGEQLSQQKILVFKTLLISEEGSGNQRTRKEWSSTGGLRNSQQIMQGKNASYPGDRYLFDENVNVLQIHKIQINPEIDGAPRRPLYFLAIKIGNNWINIRREGNH